MNKSKITEVVRGQKERFVDDRTKAISAMFDRDKGCGTLHTTSLFFEDLDSSVNSSLLSLLEAVEGAIQDGSYAGVLESNEKRRGYDIARGEFLSVISEAKKELLDNKGK